MDRLLDFLTHPFFGSMSIVEFIALPGAIVAAVYSLVGLWASWRDWRDLAFDFERDPSIPDGALRLFLARTYARGALFDAIMAQMLMLMMTVLALTMPASPTTTPSRNRWVALVVTFVLLSFIYLLAGNMYLRSSARRKVRAEYERKEAEAHAGDYRI